MQRARRLASVAVVASLAVVGLSACRSEPSVAAYFGDSGRVSESRVQEIWDDAQRRLVAAADSAAATPQQPGAPSKAPAAAGPPSMPITRADIVATVLGVEILNRVAQEQKLTVPASPNVQDYATALHLSADSTFVQLYAQQDTLLSQLKAAAKNPPDPSDADFQQVYDVLAATGQVEPSTSLEAFKTNLAPQNLALVKSSSAVRGEIVKAADALHIRINPRYQPLAVPVLQLQAQDGSLKPLITAPLGGNDAVAPVVDAH